jgi:hypothetical protein
MGQGEQAFPMPWDRFGQPEVADETPTAVQGPGEDELPYVPPEDNLPDTRESFQEAVAASTKEALEQLGPWMREQALNYGKQVAVGTVTGQDIDHANPTITGSTIKGDPLVIADAKSRSWRTFVQGIAIDIFIALVAVLATVSNFDPFQKETWIVVGALVVKTIIQSITAFVMRLRVTPTVKVPRERVALVPQVVPTK